MSVPRSPRLFGFGKYPNYVGLASTEVATIAVGFDAAGLPPTNLQTDEPSELARFSTISPGVSGWVAVFAAPREIGGMALINHNVSRSGLIRFLANVVDIGFVDTAPNAITGGVNITGAVTDIDENLSSPDSNFIAPTVISSDWSVRVTFPTPASTPPLGAHMALFVLRVILVAHTPGDTATTIPVITGELYESGLLVRNLGSRPVSVTTGDGQLLFFTFDPAELAAPDCSNVEIKISCTEGVGSDDFYVKLNTVRLLTDAAASNGATNDSGWIESPTANIEDPEEGSPPSVHTDYFPATPWSDVNSLVVQVLDDQTIHDPPTIGGGGSDEGAMDAAILVEAPTGYIQAGVFAAGKVLSLESSPKVGSAPQFGVIVEERGGKTEGGQSYAADSFRFRTMSANFLLNRDEVTTLLDGLEYRRGKARPIYINLDPDLTPERSAFMSGWVTFVESGLAIPEVMAYYDDDRMLFTKSYTFEEKL